jgi:hypothetical protein
MRLQKILRAKCAPTFDSFLSVTAREQRPARPIRGRGPRMSCSQKRGSRTKVAALCKFQVRGHSFRRIATTCSDLPRPVAADADGRSDDGGDVGMSEFVSLRRNEGAGDPDRNAKE